LGIVEKEYKEHEEHDVGCAKGREDVWEWVEVD
jgi:hypothetical protein